MIGNPRDARRAVLGGQAPDWTGSQRRVYAVEEVAYKVPTLGRDDANAREARAAELLAGLPGIPPLTVYRVSVDVIAMPLYEPLGELSDADRERWADLDWMVSDVGPANLRRGPDGLVLVDLSEGVLRRTPRDPEARVASGPR